MLAPTRYQQFDAAICNHLVPYRHDGSENVFMLAILGSLWFGGCTGGRGLRAAAAMTGRQVTEKRLVADAGFSLQTAAENQND
jgi:hypothetical protein